MDTRNYVLSLAVLTAFREERSNGLNGVLAVMFVIKNRANANWNNGDVYRIITAKNQFDSIVRIGDSQTVFYPDPTDPVFIKACQYADGILDGTTADNLTSGAKYYADMNSPGYTKDGWFAKNIVESPDHPRTTTIGSTSYFK
jgi:hypothetical protein